MADKYEELVRDAVKQGFSLSDKRRGHRYLKAPDGEVIYFSTSSSDHRAYFNLRSRLRHHGFDSKF